MRLLRFADWRRRLLAVSLTSISAVYFPPCMAAEDGNVKVIFNTRNFGHVRSP